MLIIAGSEYTKVAKRFEGEPQIIETEIKKIHLEGQSYNKWNYCCNYFPWGIMEVVMVKARKNSISDKIAD